MISVALDYQTPSFAEQTDEQAVLGLTANARRPVRLHGRVTRSKLLLRRALQTLGQVVWSNETWLDAEDYMAVILDPVITVHPDRVFFEAFSQDQSVYGLVIADRDLFETEGDVTTGTTNVDFTRWLWTALGELRSNRETWFRVGPEGFQVETTGAQAHFERKVDLPEDWVRGFLQLQGAMAMPGTRLTVRALDLLGAIRYEQRRKARMSPRALRFELEPGSEALLVLEPWEEVIPLRGTEHNYTKRRVIRTWGRKRLRLLERLLPFSEEVDIYLKGRALPSFYAVKAPGITFLLGLSGWTSQRWTETASFDLLSDVGGEDEALLEQTLAHLRERYSVSIGKLSEVLGVDRTLASRLLVRLCRRGQAIFDVERLQYRHRELFETPIEEERLYPSDPRKTEAEALLRDGRFRIDSCEIKQEVRHRKVQTADGIEYRDQVYRDWHVRGGAGDVEGVELVINHSGRIIFGRCDCEFFRENQLNKGPCSHMYALFRASASRRDGDAEGHEQAE
jgi:hypothetical protein